MRALVIEDERSVNELVTRMLTREAWSVASAGTEGDARRLFKPGLFDLVVSDIGLGEADGLELARELRRLDPRVRIIMMSGDPVNAERHDVAEVGSFLQKPFTLAQLRRLLPHEPP